MYRLFDSRVHLTVYIYLIPVDWLRSDNKHTRYLRNNFKGLLNSKRSLQSMQHRVNYYYYILSNWTGYFTVEHTLLSQLEQEIFNYRNMSMKIIH